MKRAEEIAKGREAFGARAWGDAFRHLAAADGEVALDPGDLVPMSTAAQLIGREEDAVALLARAHRGFVERDDSHAAARCATRLTQLHFHAGDRAQASGWHARAQRLLDACDPPCVERGHLLISEALLAILEGDLTRVFQAFEGAETIGRKFGDADLVAIALNGQGRAWIKRGDPARGVMLLDEAMLAVTSDEVSPLLAGIVYCSVLEGCDEILDLRRAGEWTAALDQWCASQPEIVPFRGHCQLRRAEVLELQGDWAQALDEATHARDRLSDPAPRGAAGAAYYRIAELQRLRGELALAEAAYREAGRWDRTPRPGLARLRLAQGQKDAALQAIRGAAAEATSPGNRARVLDALAEIAAACGEVFLAREAADELLELAGRLASPWPHALAARANGAALLADQDARAHWSRCGSRGTCGMNWRRPTRVRVRVSIALALRTLGDEAGARRELDAARAAFESLGAAPDAARARTLAARATAPGEAPLTDREMTVIRLVASGRTNKEIAGELGISEKTVARHLSNIFDKLDLPSRAAATAYAYEHRLV
jgi:DNA-binding CsgD family transcriptional regulator